MRKGLPQHQKDRCKAMALNRFGPWTTFLQNIWWTALLCWHLMNS